ncbi:MAG TPA: hypothetical protein VGF84_00085 [Micromonosporaceae bacterium]
MQILEVSELGLRSAILRLKHRTTPMQFLIFPMTHMARAEFYREVGRILREADIIVAEGVKGRSVLGFTLTATYRILARRPGINLTHQSIDYKLLGKPVINPDVTNAEFATLGESTVGAAGADVGSNGALHTITASDPEEAAAQTRHRRRAQRSPVEPR